MSSRSALSALSLCLGLALTLSVTACKKKESPPPVGATPAKGSPTAAPAVAATTTTGAATTAAAPSAATAPAGAKSARLAALSKSYLDGLFRAKPHLATFMGEHRYDGELPDYSNAAMAARERELVAQQKEAADLGLMKLERDDAIDLAILNDGIALELLYIREIRDFTWDPRLHDSFPFYDPREILSGRLSDIIHGTFAPAAARKASIVSQLEKLPAFLTTAKALYTNPSKICLLYTSPSPRD